MKHLVKLVFTGILCCCLLLSCSNPNSNSKDPIVSNPNSDSIISEGTPTNPVEIPLSVNTKLSIGHDSFSYYQFSIPQNNYYTISISNISASDGFGLFDMNLCSDTSYQSDYDQSPLSNMLLPKTVKLYKNQKYFIRIHNYHDTEGLSFQINISEKSPYPKLTELSIDTEYNGTIGKYGVPRDYQYFSFTTESAGYYQIYFLHPSYPDYSNFHYSQMLYDFMPDIDFHSQGTAYGKYNEYSLLANTTYYITWCSEKPEPLDYTVLVHKVD